MQSKKTKAQIWLNNHTHVLLRCPHCHQVLNFLGNYWECQMGHRFDLARQGYGFLSKRPSDSHYQRSLFQVRREIIMDSPFYHALHHRIQTLLADMSWPTILDAGSGEGSHLYKITQDLGQYTAIGIDLSKDGIYLSTDYNDSQLSLVADLADIPLMDHQCDVILSIFSPSNYQEFHRLLKPHGKLIKVVPNSGYLQEIRQVMSNQGWMKEQDYENTEVVEAFCQQYPHAEIQKIHEQVALDDTMRRKLIRMTPLTWNLQEDQLELLAQRLSETLTLDVRLLIHQHV